MSLELQTYTPSMPKIPTLQMSCRSPHYLEPRPLDGHPNIFPSTYFITREEVVGGTLYNEVLITPSVISNIHDPKVMIQIMKDPKIFHPILESETRQAHMDSYSFSRIIYIKTSGFQDAFKYGDTIHDNNFTGPGGDGGKYVISEMHYVDYKRMMIWFNLTNIQIKALRKPVRKGLLAVPMNSHWLPSNAWWSVLYIRLHMRMSPEYQLLPALDPAHNEAFHLRLLPNLNVFIITVAGNYSAQKKIIDITSELHADPHSLPPQKPMPTSPPPPITLSPLEGVKAATNSIQCKRNVIPRLLDAPTKGDKPEEYLA